MIPRTEFRLAHDPGMRNALGSLHGGVSLCFAELAACTGWEASPDFPGELLTFAVATLHRVATM